MRYKKTVGAGKAMTLIEKIKRNFKVLDKKKTIEKTVIFKEENVPDQKGWPYEETLVQVEAKFESGEWVIAYVQDSEQRIFLGNTRKDTGKRTRIKCRMRKYLRYPDLVAPLWRKIHEEAPCWSVFDDDEYAAIENKDREAKEAINQLGAELAEEMLEMCTKRRSGWDIHQVAWFMDRHKLVDQSVRNEALKAGIEFIMDEFDAGLISIRITGLSPEDYIVRRATKLRKIGAITKASLKQIVEKCELRLRCEAVDFSAESRVC